MEGTEDKYFPRKKKAMEKRTKREILVTGVDKFPNQKVHVGFMVK